jgi:Family of unknown function (DUF6492)
MTNTATLLTPTYGRDIDRFLLLRESLERLEVGIPHIAVVHDEDMPAFKNIPFQAGLQIMSTRDVLPEAIEKRRVQPSYRRWHPMRYLRKPRIHGWDTQQVIKLAAPDFIKSTAVVCLDSDVFLTRPISHETFFTDNGDLQLYADDGACTVQTVVWMAESMQALGVPLDKRPTCFIHNPVPMHRETTLGLRSTLEQKHSKSWIDAFLDLHLTEYTSYGVYARDVRMLDGLHMVKPPHTLNYWVPESFDSIEAELCETVLGADVRFVCVQSNIGKHVNDYRHIVDRVWRSLGV